MAILIPSKHIYQKENPKVRDNAIERIEVNAKNVIPNNKTDEVVYNTTISGFTKGEGSEVLATPIKEYAALGTSNNIYSAEYFEISKNATKYVNGKITIPKTVNNGYISKIVQKDKNNLQYVVKGKVKSKNCTATLTDIDKENYSKTATTYGDEKEESGVIEFPELPLKVGSIKSPIKNNTNVNLSLEEDNDNYYLGYKILWYYLSEYLKGKNFDLFDYIETVSLGGKHEEYIAEQIEITVYGNTIGIDLEANTVYIPETDKTSKKVFDISGSELMQTQNYILDEGDELSQGTDFVWYFGLDQNGVERQEFADINIKNESLYGKTIKIVISSRGGDATYYREAVSNSIIINNGYYIEGIKIYLSTVVPLINWQYKTLKSKYANGKETATIRCSISDYYDYDDQTKKVVAIDNSTKKMAFEEYDQVIPMVYGADGQDRPMSLNKDGSPKIFTVLGTKIFYDGAIWQEISLQEA